MGVFESLKNSVQGYFDKKREDREFVERLQREADAQKKILFEEEFKKNALEVAKAEAHKNAAKLSGLQKLRAMNRARRLTEPGQGQGMFSKLSEYTQKNIAKREENIKRTAELRDAGKKMREEKLAEQQKTRQERMAQREVKKPFGTWQ